MCALGGTTPASADSTGEPVIRLAQPIPLALAPATSTGLTKAVEPGFQFHTTAGSVNAMAVLTIDVSDLTKIAKVTFSDNCTVKDSVATCDEWFYGEDLTKNEGLGTETQMTIRALPDAVQGASATYKVTGSADTARIVGATGSVQIGGPAFNLRQPPDHTDLPVGSVVSEPVRFTNIGTRPADATEVVLMASPGLEFTRRYANCEYSVRRNTTEAIVALCTFPDRIDTGETAALAAPVRLKVESTAYYTFLDAVAAPLGDPNQTPILDGRTWTQGTGGELGLKVVKPGQPSSAPSGTVPLQQSGSRGDYRITSLQADNTADFSVTGASAQAAAGDTVTMSFTMTDNGPATIFDRSGEPLGVTVTLPPGTTGVASSANCQPESGDDPPTAAHGPYSCSGSYLVPSGKTYTFSITLRVDQVVPGAQGSVAMAWSPDGSWRPAYDQIPADDSAPLTLN